MEEITQMLKVQYMLTVNETLAPPPLHKKHKHMLEVNVHALVCHWIEALDCDLLGTRIILLQSSEQHSVHYWHSDIVVRPHSGIIKQIKTAYTQATDHS